MMKYNEMDDFISSEYGEFKDAIKILSFESGMPQIDMGAADVLKRLGYKTDNPGGEWLEGTRRAAKKRAESAEANKCGISWSAPTTAYIRGLMFPISRLQYIPGACGEHIYIKENDPRVIDLSNKISKDGFLTDRAPFINVRYDGKPFVNEGNHRIRAAKLSGLTHIPIDISWFDGSEEVDGFNPSDVLKNYIFGLGLLSLPNLKSYDTLANVDFFEAGRLDLIRLPDEEPRHGAIYPDGTIYLIPSNIKSTSNISIFDVQAGNMIEISEAVKKAVPRKQKRTIKI